MPKKETVNLVIVNTEPRGIALPPVPANKTDVPEEIHGKMLIPGENDVTEAAWNYIYKEMGNSGKGSKAVHTWVECGYLEVKGPGQAQSLGSGLDALTSKEAKEKIAGCDDVKVLKTWREKTTKKTAVKLINEKIDELIKNSGKEE